MGGELGRLVAYGEIDGSWAWFAMTGKKNLSARRAIDEGKRDAGAAIDLGITVSVYGRSGSGTLEKRDCGVSPVMATAWSADIDTWPTEH